MVTEKVGQECDRVCVSFGTKYCQFGKNGSGNGRVQQACGISFVQKADDRLHLGLDKERYAPFGNPPAVEMRLRLSRGE